MEEEGGSEGLVVLMYDCLVSLQVSLTGGGNLTDVAGVHDGIQGWTMTWLPRVIVMTWLSRLKVMT